MSQEKDINNLGTVKRVESERDFENKEEYLNT
jgi:hypothetical protein